LLVSPSASPSGLGEATSVAPIFHEALTPNENPNPNVAGRDPSRVDRSPPAPITERPGGSPTSPEARWIEGYWDWDPGRNDYVWVAGLWRVPPPGTFWVNGYWRRDDRGWYRVPGFWSARRETTAPAAGPVPSGSPRDVASELVATTRPAPRPPFAPPDRVGPASQPVPTTTPLEPPPTDPPTPTSYVLPTRPINPTPPASITLADQLAGQAAGFEQVFGRTARITPQGGAFLADAQRLRIDAMALRQMVATGDNPRAALTFRDIDLTWRRMIQRVNMISPGRSGPNIQQIWRMGDTIGQLSRVMP